MSNMSYCRFQNTANDLRDCAREHLEQEHLDDMVDDEFENYFTELEQE